MKVAENKFQAKVSLLSDPHPYYIDTVDGKILDTEYSTIGRKFYLRIKEKDSNWIELTCVVKNPTAPGTAAKFEFNYGRITNPIRCED